MKSLLIYLLLPVITFRVENANHEPVRLMKPINGKYQIAAWATDTLDAHGELKIPNQDKISGTYEFQYKQKTYRLYVQPGKDYTLTISKDSVKIKAKDDEGQLALNRLAFPFYQSVAMAWYKADTVYDNNKKKVLTEMEQHLQPFRTLLEQQKINKGFYQYAEKLIKVYYANMLACTFIMPMMKLEFSKDSTRYDAAKMKAISSYWQDVFAVADPHDTTSMNVNTYFDYVNYYDTWYLGYFLPGSQGTYKRSTLADEYWTRKYDLIQPNYKEPLRQYLYANWIYALTMEDGFQPFVLDWFRDFKTAYPQSPYTTKLVAGVDKVRDYQEKIRKDFSTGQQFVENYSTITSFDELAEKFKGKTVYVDLWATWCGPCKAEFAYNKSLKPFLQKNGVQSLYISIDNDAADKQWKDMIRYYDLQGYHIRASPKLMDDIRKLFSTNKGLAIPRYAILKDGKMVLDNARAPSDQEALYKQIASFL
ncbi:redoxin family protein [Chitinophaga sp. SYP-B3965]|uniref:TlpA family protein disulfide reductase n=1 Tax=Chitinophaga sp. SYP-B3965 TaxID=2663120 RepID=UPI0012999389|nr:TlpA disulfide reductase family protein [Chitinophaga sp. SYP-B3965]MRG44623.1 redoxin family protein [Chitinophaga sp. SYP-B3965]